MVELRGLLQERDLVPCASDANRGCETAEAGTDDGDVEGRVTHYSAHAVWVIQMVGLALQRRRFGHRSIGRKKERSGEHENQGVISRKILGQRTTSMLLCVYVSCQIRVLAPKIRSAR